MATWMNWSSSARALDADLRFVRSVDDLQATIVEAASQGRHVRTAGAGHSHFPLVPTDGVIVDLSGLNGVTEVRDADGPAPVAVVRAGTPIAALGRPLHDAGVALANQGDIDRQTIAGATATGTHGTGRTLPNLSASVVGLSVVTADGELVRLAADAGDRADTFAAARLGLGAFGVVTEVELAVVPAYRLAERAWRLTYDEVRTRTVPSAAEHRHFEFFWYPRGDLAVAKAIDITDAPAEYPVAPEGRRVAWSYEVLPNHRPHLHTEMEFAVPIESSLECLDEIRALLVDVFTDVRWPVEYRTVAADDVWLSQADGRDVATISVHEGVDTDPSAYFAACEAVFRRYDGRPHWGKVHGFDAEDLRNAHPRWDDWWRRRDGIDPDGVFLNDVLASWRP
jgi:FAD/FMN-containing dehydrogenase